MTLDRILATPSAALGAGDVDRESARLDPGEPGALECATTSGAACSGAR
jgi:hypothetical protein